MSAFSRCHLHWRFLATTVQLHWYQNDRCPYTPQYCYPVSILKSCFAFFSFYRYRLSSATKRKRNAVLVRVVLVAVTETQTAVTRQVNKMKQNRPAETVHRQNQPYRANLSQKKTEKLSVSFSFYRIARFLSRLVAFGDWCFVFESTASLLPPLLKTSPLASVFVEGSCRFSLFGGIRRTPKLLRWLYAKKIGMWSSNDSSRSGEVKKKQKHLSQADTQTSRQTDEAGKRKSADKYKAKDDSNDGYFNGTPR